MLKCEGDTSDFKEQIKRLEQEIEKLKKEITIHEENELKSRETIKEKTNKANLLEKELQEAKIEIDELLSKFLELK